MGLERPHRVSSKYSKLLAKKLDADEEVCEIAAWLHDIRKLKGVREKHHVFGADEAEEILKGSGYPSDKISMVKECILTHSSDENYPPKTLEAKIVASADALSHFDNFLALAHSSFKIKGLSISEGKESIIQKYKTCWAKLIPEAKEIAQQKYEAIKLILGEQD